MITVLSEKKTEPQVGLYREMQRSRREEKGEGIRQQVYSERVWAYQVQDAGKGRE
jgi:hypothetical protein